MKYFLILLILSLCVIGASIGAIWLKIRPDGYPFVRTFSSEDGRSAEFRVEGKEDERFFFARTDDLRENPRIYEMQISETGLVNRAILLSMPNHAPPKPKEEKDPYLASREERIARLIEELAQVKADEQASKTNKIGARREWTKEKDTLNAEISELEADIDQFKQR